ncbi:hypothetical protein BDR04DRAFT_1123276 [Suillus decipiens]|nr:hypothetical protein BDR04DRAFT_1123276 [Suillus decipiens]
MRTGCQEIRLPKVRQHEDGLNSIQISFILNSSVTPSQSKFPTEDCRGLLRLLYSVPIESVLSSELGKDSTGTSSSLSVASLAGGSGRTDDGVANENMAGAREFAVAGRWSAVSMWIGNTRQNLIDHPRHLEKLHSRLRWNLERAVGLGLLSDDIVFNLQRMFEFSKFKCNEMDRADRLPRASEKRVRALTVIERHNTKRARWPSTYPQFPETEARVTFQTCETPTHPGGGWGFSLQLTVRAIVLSFSSYPCQMPCDHLTVYAKARGHAVANREAAELGVERSQENDSLKATHTPSKIGQLTLQKFAMQGWLYFPLLQLVGQLNIKGGYRSHWRTNWTNFAPAVRPPTGKKNAELQDLQAVEARDLQCSEGTIGRMTSHFTTTEQCKHILLQALLAVKAVMDRVEIYHSLKIYTPHPSSREITKNMSQYVFRAQRKFKPYDKHGRLPTALELRYIDRFCGKYPGETDMTLADVIAGKEIFERSIALLSEETITQMIAAKRAACESMRLRAMTTAWEIQASSEHSKLLDLIFEREASKFADCAAAASFLEMLVPQDKQELEATMDFQVGAYSHDLTSLAVGDLQLEQAERLARKLSEESDGSDLDHYDVGSNLLESESESDG